MEMYFLISLAIIIISIISNLYLDREYLYFSVIISDICEGLIIGLSWIISIPILVIGNIIISIFNIIISIKEE